MSSTNMWMYISLGPVDEYPVSSITCVEHERKLKEMAAELDTALQRVVELEDQVTVLKARHCFHENLVKLNEDELLLSRTGKERAFHDIVKTTRPTNATEGPCPTIRYTTRITLIETQRFHALIL